jgi:hypothetical protein
MPSSGRRCPLCSRLPLPGRFTAAIFLLPLKLSFLASFRTYRYGTSTRVGVTTRVALLVAPFIVAEMVTIVLILTGCVCTVNVAVFAFGARTKLLTVGTAATLLLVSFTNVLTATGPSRLIPARTVPPPFTELGLNARVFITGGRMVIGAEWAMPLYVATIVPVVTLATGTVVSATELLDVPALMSMLDGAETARLVFARETVMSVGVTIFKVTVAVAGLPPASEDGVTVTDWTPRGVSRKERSSPLCTPHPTICIMYPRNWTGV